VFSKLQPEQIWLQLNDKNNYIPPRHLAAALFQLSKSPVDRTRDLSGVLAELKKNSKSLRGRDLSSILVACKRLGVSDANFWEAMRKRVGEVCMDLNAQEISNVLNALASHQFVENSLLDSLTSAVIIKIDDFTSQNIANTMHAIAKFQLRDPVLLEKIYAAALQNASSFSSIDVSITLDALGKLRCSNTELVARFCEEGLRTAVQFTPQGIANSLRALWTLDVCDHALVKVLIGRACEHLPKFNLEELSTTLKVLSALQTVDDALLAQISVAVLRNTRDFGVLSVTSLLSSLAALTPLPRSGATQQLLDRLYLEALRHVENLSATQVAEMLLALTRLGVYDGVLLEQLWQRSLRLAPNFSAEEIVIVLNSVLRFNAFNPHVVNLLCQRALSLHFSPARTVTVLHVVAHFTPHLVFKGLVQHLAQDARRQASSFSTPELVTAMCSLAVLQQPELVLFDHLRTRLTLQEPLPAETRGYSLIFAQGYMCAVRVAKCTWTMIHHWIRAIGLARTLCTDRPALLAPAARHSQL